MTGRRLQETGVLLPIHGFGFHTAAGRFMVDSDEALERVGHLFAKKEPVDGRRCGGGAAVEALRRTTGSGGRVIPRSAIPWRDHGSMTLGKRMVLGAPRIVP